REEVLKFKEKAQRAEQLGNISEVAINERKMQVALAYMLNPKDFNAGDIHHLKGDPGHRFKINYINGVFAWCHRINRLGEKYEQAEAIPIYLLDQIVEEK